MIGWIQNLDVFRTRRPQPNQARRDRWEELRLRLPLLKGRLGPPMTCGRITQSFGACTAQQTEGTDSSSGIEVMSDMSMGVRSIYWAQVAFVGWLENFGHTVILNHTHGYHSVYCRLQIALVQESDIVEPRQIIGAVDGTSSNGEGGSLYFELRKNGSPIDPGPWFF